MRGKQLVPDPDAVGTGITPADAGKTVWNPYNTPIREDHPRGCGENIVESVEKAYVSGSPPRMRGKHDKNKCSYIPPGITPADAGKTIRLQNGMQNRQDHPRGCGENCAEQHVVMRFEGSPPRMRGKPDHRPWQRTVRGITPADAGKTLSRLA